MDKKNVQHEIDTHLSDIEFTSKNKKAVFALAKGEIVVNRKLSVALVLTMVLILAALGVAVAAGLGVFGQLAQETNSPELENLEAVAQTYDNNVQTEQTDSYYLPVDITLSQAHYDGQSLFLSYSVSLPSETMELMDIGWAKEHEWIWGPDELIHQRTLEDRLSVEDFAAMQEAYNEAGEVCVMLYAQGTGDGVQLSDGTSLSVSASDMNILADGTLLMSQEMQSPLPEAAQNQDELTVYLSVLRSRDLYYYNADGEHSDVWNEPEGVEPVVHVPITLYRNGTYHTLNGERGFEAYSVQAAAMVSNADVKVECIVATPQAWKDAWNTWNSNGEDFLLGFRPYKDGVPLSDDTGSVDTQNNGFRVSLDFARPATLDELELRPIFSISGEHTDEAILLR